MPKFPSIGPFYFDHLLFIKHLLLILFIDFANGAQLRKTHPIELTIKSGSIRGEYLVRFMQKECYN